VNPPDPSLIPQSELLGVTAILISVSYKQKEFFRAGYFVYNSIEELQQYEGQITEEEMQALIL